MMDGKVIRISLDAYKKLLGIKSRLEIASGNTRIFSLGATLDYTLQIPKHKDV